MAWIGGGGLCVAILKEGGRSEQHGGVNADSVVFLNSGYRSRVVRVQDILTIQSNKNDVIISLNDGPILVRGSITKCMDRLPTDFFFLASRGCLVNLLQVDKVDAAARNIRLAMKDGREIMMSRKQSVRFRKELVF